MERTVRLKGEAGWIQTTRRIEMIPVRKIVTMSSQHAPPALVQVARKCICYGHFLCGNLPSMSSVV